MRLLLIAFLACSAITVGAAQPEDTVIVHKSRSVLFRPNYSRQIEKTYVNGKLKRKKVSLNCTSCTYNYTVRSRTRNYR